MALIKCPDCGKEVSEYSDNCPSCGFPISRCKFDIVVTEVNQTDSFSYSAIANIMGGMSIADDAQRILTNLPCIIVSKDSIDESRKSVERLEKMGLKCNIEMRDKPTMPQNSNTEYISSELLDNLSKLAIAAGIIIGIIVWATGSYDYGDFEWNWTAFMNCLNIVFASIGTGIVFKFMAEVLNRLSK